MLISASLVASTLVASVVVTAAPASQPSQPVLPTIPSPVMLPDISDNSHATPEVVRYFQSFFETKSSLNKTLWQETFDPTHTSYSDAVLGFSVAGNATYMQQKFFTGTSSAKPGSSSYPLFILGDTNSAIVHMIDTPGFFGAEVRTLSTFDFTDGLATRVVDYWDGRRNPIINGVPPLGQVSYSKYDYQLGLNGTKETATSTIQSISTKLNRAFSTGDANASLPLFSYDAVFEDFTLRMRQEGQLAIGRYLERALPQLPYGLNATVRHVLGTDQGGGYEWATTNRSVINGVTALQLNDAGLITTLSAIWDSSRMSDGDLKSLVALAIEP